MPFFIPHSRVRILIYSYGRVTWGKIDAFGLDWVHNHCGIYGPLPARKRHSGMPIAYLMQTMRNGVLRDAARKETKRQAAQEH